MIGPSKVEIRAVGLKAMRDKRGLTQRKLAHDLGISQNYIHAIEANARQAGPKLQDALVKYFDCDFGDLFEVVLVNQETGQEQPLAPRKQANVVGYSRGGGHHTIPVETDIFTDLKNRPPSAFRSPLTNHLFSDLDHNNEALDLYPQFSRLIAWLRNISLNNANLEQQLAGLRDRGDTDRTALIQLAAIRYYLRRVLTSSVAGLVRDWSRHRPARPQTSLRSRSRST